MVGKRPRTQAELLTWIVEEIQTLKRGNRRKRAATTEGQRIEFTPVILSGVALGNGSVKGSYVVTGKRALIQIELTLGSTSDVTGDIRFQTPLALAAGVQITGGGRLTMGGSVYDVTTLALSTSLYVRFRRVSGSNVIQASASPTIPASWGAGVLTAYYDVQLA